MVSNDPTPTVESPDANMVLKYMFGVSEWKRWVQLKNDEQAGRGKPFKMEILQCTADELNFSLCLFVKEARREDGEEYSPDTIYNMCLGGSLFTRFPILEFREKFVKYIIHSSQNQKNWCEIEKTNSEFSTHFYWP